MSQPNLELSLKGLLEILILNSDVAPEEKLTFISDQLAIYSTTAPSDLLKMMANYEDIRDMSQLDLEDLLRSIVKELRIEIKRALCAPGQIGFEAQDKVHVYPPNALDVEGDVEWSCCCDSVPKIPKAPHRVADQDFFPFILIQDDEDTIYFSDSIFWSYANKVVDKSKLLVADSYDWTPETPENFFEAEDEVTDKELPETYQPNRRNVSKLKNILTTAAGVKPRVKHMADVEVGIVKFEESYE
ncbi:hypothetical protein IFR05_012026 [Cadophora sp. M221]|nr:hypothetical protein IFR05_012026 [Cadophora sp. M221]